MKIPLQRSLASLLLITVACATCTCAAVLDGDESEAGKLDIITLLPGKLKAVYLQTTNKGIYFHSESRENSEFLLISTLEGEQLYMVEHSYGSILYSVRGKIFLLTSSTLENKRYLTGYAVPPSHKNKVTKALKKQHITRRLLNALDAEGANVTRTSAFEDLLQQPER